MDCEKCQYYNKALTRCRYVLPKSEKEDCTFFKELKIPAGQFCDNCYNFLPMSGRPGSHTACVRYNYERLTWIIDDWKIKYKKCKQCLAEVQK